MDILHTACFTGHRPQHLPFREGSAKFAELISDLEYEILELFSLKGVNTFITGMALGVDTYAARIIIKMKDRGSDIRLVCAIPCTDQSSRWSRSEREEYRYILSRADEVVFLQDEYTPGCMQRRNEFMVNNSSYVIAVWNGNSGGTCNTAKYAMRTQKTLIRLNPLDY